VQRIAKTDLSVLFFSWLQNEYQADWFPHFSGQAVVILFVISSASFLYSARMIPLLLILNLPYKTMNIITPLYYKEILYYT